MSYQSERHEQVGGAMSVDSAFMDWWTNSPEDVLGTIQEGEAFNAGWRAGRADNGCELDRLGAAEAAIRTLRAESDPVVAAAQRLVRCALGDGTLWGAVIDLREALSRCPPSRGEGPYAGNKP